MLGVRLTESNSGREVEPALGLPSHARERVLAAAHAEAVAAGMLPNDGLPLEDARITVTGSAEESAIVVHVGAGGRSFARRFDRLTLFDDVSALVAERLASGALAAGSYRFAFVDLPAPPPREGALRVAPFPRALPRLPVISLREAGIRELPGCTHVPIYLPERLALGLVALARSTPEVETGAAILVHPFLVAEPAPSRLALYVSGVVPLGEGTRGDACRLRVPPAALAAVPQDPARGRHLGGLAHSHPTSEGTAHFLSVDDVDLATRFYWMPFHVQIVIDPRETDPRRALALYAWVGARLDRVCFQPLDDGTRP
jgi:hypothetical protein